MGVSTSTVSSPLYTTVVVDTEANTTLETFNDANTTLYMVEGVNPNEKAVWVRINWAASGGATSTQNDTLLYFPANNTTHYIFGAGFPILAGMRVWCSTEKGLGGGQVTLNSPTSKVTLRMAFKDT
tara:strand:+ start:709 stop:1086 length:378 start_codon:yes stop_codon:yes gene_type:complete